MCGILGFSGRFAESALRTGLDLIAHRGPDDSGVFVDEKAEVGLGHRRLSILELSPLGHQPMESPQGGVLICYNGEVYNFRELRGELEKRGHTFKGHSDTEVILHLYLEHGEAMLPMLNGIFALAIWDPRSQSMLLARDGLGVKPLYLATTPRGLVFASEMKAIFPLAPDCRTLDPVAIDRYLTFLWCPGEGTPLKEVRKVLPGQAMILKRGKIDRSWTYYSLPVFRSVKADLSEEESIKGTLEHLRTAVHRQLVADVPVGAFLSGGLDSSAIVALAREATPGIRCFSIDAGGALNPGDADDLPYAHRVAKHLGVPLEVIRIDPSRMAGELPWMIEQLDEPLADFAALNAHYICKLARDHDMKVLLSGAGGDDLFTGYRRHTAVKYQGWWSWLPAAVRDSMERVAAGLDQRKGLSRRITKLLSGAGLDGDERIANYFTWAPSAQIAKLYSADFRAALGGHRAVEPMLDFLRPLPPSVQPLDRMLACEQRFFLADHNLTYTDKMAMAVGVEVRVPFLDYDLVEFAQRIPLGVKQRGRVGKHVLKKAMEPFLPHDVIYRPKAGFGVPLRRWIREDYRSMISEVLSPERLVSRGMFDPNAVQALIAANNRGTIDASYTILSILGLEFWCRKYLDGVRSAVQ